MGLADAFSVALMNNWNLGPAARERAEQSSRKAIMLAIRPHDELRYGRRIWLDVDTGFPLQTKLIDGNGDTIEQVKFADINLVSSISAEALSPSFDLDSFTWHPAAVERIAVEVQSDWVSDDLPVSASWASVRNPEGRRGPSPTGTSGRLGRRPLLEASP